MTSTVFQPGTTITHQWLNDVNTTTYTGLPNEIANRTSADTAIVTNLSNSSGSSLVGYTEGGTGAVATTVQAKLRASISVEDFGAIGNGTTDDSAAIQAAISSFGPNVAGVVNFKSTSTYKIGTRLLLPTNIILEGNGCSFVGAGTMANDAIHTAYYVGSTLTDLVGGSYGTYLFSTEIIGIKFTNFNIALNLQGLNQACAVKQCRGLNCKQFLVNKDSYFLLLEGLYCNYIGVGLGLAAFEFSPLCGQLVFNGLSVGNSDLAYLFGNTTQATDIKLLDAENCITGIRFANPTYNVNIHNCYFEAISGTAIDFSTFPSTITGGIIHNNWFNNVGTCVDFTGSNAISTKILDNTFNGTITYQVNFGTVPSATKIEVDNGVIIFDNVTGTYPIKGTINGAAYTQYTQNAATKWNYFHQISTNYSSVSGNLQAKAFDYMGTITPFNYYGTHGVPDANQIPFCKATAVNIVGSAFDIKVTTNITYSAFATGLFALSFQDGVSTYIINGRFTGTTGYLDTASGKTLTVANTGGVITLTFSGFSNAGNTFVGTGFVKMI